MPTGIIARATAADWRRFALLATAEQWRISAVERRLFQGPWHPSACALQVADGFAGFVTAVSHQRSGWIGNLIVPPRQRRRGYGRELFASALQQLERTGVTGCWLTASEQGRPLYEAFGFVAVDRMERWVRKTSPVVKGGGISPQEAPVDMLSAADQAVWGEERQALLTALAAGSRCFCRQENLLCLQTDGDFQLLGPWYACDPHPDLQRELLAQALVVADPKRELVIDLLASAALQPLLAECGFEPVSGAVLMVRGESVTLAQRGFCALASLGSIG